MPRKIESLALAIYNPTTGELTPLDPATLLIREGDVVGCASGGELPASILAALPHREAPFVPRRGRVVVRLPVREATEPEPLAEPEAPAGELDQEALLERIRALDPDSRVNRSYGMPRLREILAGLEAR